MYILNDYSNSFPDTMISFSSFQQDLFHTYFTSQNNPSSYVKVTLSLLIFN